MTFNTAIASLRNGFATKRPSWKGYISCKATTDDYFAENPPAVPGSPTDEETAAANAAISGGWKLLEFHLADGTTVVPYILDSNPANDIKKNGSAVNKDGNTLTVYDGYVPLTQFLFDAILQSDWENIATADAEILMAGANEY